MHKKNSKKLTPRLKYILQILAEILSQGLKLEKDARIGEYARKSFICLNGVLRKRLDVKSNSEAIRIGLKRGWIDESKLPNEFVKTFKKTSKVVFPIVPTQREISFLKGLSGIIKRQKHKAHKSFPLTRLRKAFGLKTDASVIVKAVKLGWIDIPFEITEFCSQIELAKGKLTPKNIIFLEKVAKGLKEGKMLIDIRSETDYAAQGSFFGVLTRIRQHFGVSSVKKLIKLGQKEGWLKP